MASKTPFGASNIPRIIIISTITIAITILLWSLKLSVPFFFYPQPPIIKLNNLLVSNFKVLDSNLVSIWLGNITVYNPNIALSIHTNQLEASILYKHDYPLSLTTVDNLELYVWEKRDVFVKFVTTGNESDQPIIEYPLMKEIEKDWKTGKLNFRVRFSAMIRYEIDCPGLRGRTVMMNPHTIDLDVIVEDGRRRRRKRGENSAIYDIIGDIPKDGRSWLIMVNDD
ncbi:hypothetical protein ERO13_D10G099500v2 [Gossypium hirsutum]|uniref:Late embryogenesis abundant protein LEA-2 subgroup domain-containing protein n=9 Tax=Gossypium TaxID=3633 RepID=A0A7J9K2L6_9ROSI|nr:hypothetical protein ES319_D10G107700v1 [Gossypium barbadense]KAG4125507.1 hypothetical protein ERO13_D10G099500v2 [Gossypium hirsutum]MBA0628307.1 hypothetical protein [Gossypium davidsonii]MBA0664026.1 hypothetical protein [Gossypium klotzschianum]MBA0695956.1 hypothetical protein [Gossypium aridum]MBA0724682.1 hypothetical protein [Gossypium laxum]MBA0840685.1 hypothetical protein [Gossypium armourianum]TYG49700.1 hypothetical protein ES288_D10G115100v1 [Gossypium darwinii]TYH49158.1 